MFFESTIMGNTADLATVQKTIIDTPHKESKSQKVITERGGCSRSAVSKHIKRKVDWKDKNVHKQQGWPQTWEYSQAKLIQHLGELHEEWTEAGVSASRVTTLRHLQEKSYQATSETETSSVESYLGSGEKQLDCCSALQSPLLRWKYILHFICKSESGGRVERHRIHVAWSPVWSFHSQWWFGLPCHLLVLVHCVFWSPQSTQPSTGHFRALHASFCWQALWRSWFHFPAGLGTCPHCQRYQKLVQWPWCYCA